MFMLPDYRCDSKAYLGFSVLAEQLTIALLLDQMLLVPWSVHEEFAEP